MQVTQHEKRAIFRLDVALEQIAKREQLEVVTLASCWTLDETLQRSSKTTASAEGRERSIACDPEQPGFGIVDLAKLVAAAEGLVEAVLQEIFGEPPVVDHLDEKPSQTCLASTEKTFHLFAGALQGTTLGFSSAELVAPRRRGQLFGGFPHLLIQVPIEG